jgi:RNA polymerase sigma factor, sigma-70 family
MKNKYKFKVKEKLLEKEEEYNLISSWQNTKNNKALNKLLKSYKKLVVSISKKFISYGLPQEDLIQEGTMGLMYAIEKFDISKGFRLSTYSHWWIRAMIQDYIIKNWSIVKTGSTASQKILFFSFNKIKKLINFDSLKTMDINEVEKISKILNMNHWMLSI